MLLVHWATFNLGIHAWPDPPERVLAGARAAGVAIVMPRPGQMVDPSAPAAIQPWWQ